MFILICCKNKYAESYKYVYIMNIICSYLYVVIYLVVLYKYQYICKVTNVRVLTD